MRNPVKLALGLAALGVILAVIGCKPAQSRGYETGDGIPARPSNVIDSNATTDNDL
jgi:hypothetical protein